MRISKLLTLEPDNVRLFRDICTASCRGLKELILEIGDAEKPSSGTILHFSFSKTVQSALIPYTVFIKEKGFPFLPFDCASDICDNLKDAWDGFFTDLTKYLSPTVIKSLQKQYTSLHEALELKIKETPQKDAEEIYDKFIEELECTSELFKNKSQKTFNKSDRKMLRKIFDSTVLSIEPDESHIIGEIRHLQVLHGVKLYKPKSKYEKGVSFMKAAKLTIKELKFKGKSGTYSENECASLARAIEREYENPKLDPEA
jgi:hypothetical protein